jgi:hypothetical protein
VDHFVDFPSLPAGNDEKLFFGALTMVHALTLLLGERLDVPRYAEYGGKLHLLCHGWYVYSSGYKHNPLFDIE